VNEPRFPHLSSSGEARMVDVSAKGVTVRTATAAARVLLSGECVAALRKGAVPKGDALAVARIAGLMAAKRTADLIPLCHPLSISGVDVTADVVDFGVDITATVKTADRTGVEMEALTAVSVAGLAVIDMIKAIDRSAVITDVRLLAKSGGRSGEWTRPEEEEAERG
jgi:cyclic pyranopterin monophosphate synthase